MFLDYTEGEKQMLFITETISSTLLFTLSMDFHLHTFTDICSTCLGSNINYIGGWGAKTHTMNIATKTTILLGTLLLRYQVLTNTLIQKSRNMTIEGEKQFLIYSSFSRAVWIKSYH